MSFRDEAAEAVQLHLFLSIIVLTLLLRLFGSAPEMFHAALFSCVSMPATYALAYYHARACRAGRFVVKKKPEPIRMWIYETAALLTSFAMGYIVFAALTGSADYVTFGAAFTTVQVMRLLTIFMTSRLRSMGVDIQHPVTVMLVSLSTAAIGLAGLSLFFTVFPV